MPSGGEGRGDRPASPRSSSSQSPEQSIPLQDLSRPPDTADIVGSPGRGEGENVRFTSREGAAFSARPRTGGRYGSILTEGLQRSDSGGHLGIPSNLRLNTHGRQPSLDEAEMSPIDIGGFSAAIGGLEPLGPLGDDDDEELGTSHSAMPQPYWQSRSRSDETIPTSSSAHSRDRSPEGDGSEDDRAPLTHPNYLAPIDGHSLFLAGQNHDRLPPGHKTSRSLHLLGDSLHSITGGRGHHHSSSSLSVPRSLGSGGRLSGATEILRKMSTRVVNLSHEPEVIDLPRRSEDNRDPDGLRPMPDFEGRTSYDRVRSPDSPPFEKPPPFLKRSERWQQQQNPLQGRTLGIFGPNNPLRLWLCNVLIHPWTEPFIFFLILLQTVLLAAKAAETVPYGQRPTGVFPVVWADVSLLALFSLYTLEIAARVIVSGFIKNADEYSSVPKNTPFFKATFQKARDLLAPERGHSVNRRPGFLAAASAPQVSIMRSFTMMQLGDETGSGPYAQKVRLARRAYLRHSFNRLDFLAVVSFWISFVLRVIPTGAGDTIVGTQHIYVFDMLSCLRITRLLGLTNGTSIILRSLKKAAPSLFNVAFLIGFFWLLFGIVGAQSFKSSLRRTCVWFGDNTEAILNAQYDPEFWGNASAYMNFWYAQNLAPENFQPCGGFLHPTTGEVHSFIRNLTVANQPPQYWSDDSWKGYICPRRSICVEGFNPYNNTIGFDNILNSLEMVFVVMSSNTWSDIMYYLTDSDYVSVVIFFVAGIVILAFWMTNLLIAVITSSFQIIREEGKQSAFTVDDSPLEEEEITVRKPSALKRVYDKTFWVWIAIVLLDTIVMCLRTADMSRAKALFIDNTESVVTLILILEIIWRFLADWRNFFRKRANWADLIIAVVTTVIQIPVIHESGAPYNWLTAFQIVRVYRVILAVPITRELIFQVLGNVSGILNLIVFVLLVTFIGAIFAFQILAGDIYQTDWNGTNNRFTFSNIWISFLGMYQILSSENWTFEVYNATQYQTQYNTAWISALFFILWFVFANFIILNMFIAVIQENFDVDEDTKRLEQVKAFLQQKDLSGATYANLSLSTILGFGRDRTKRDPIDYGPATIEMFNHTVVRDFLEEQYEAMEEELVDEADGTINPTTKAPRRNLLGRMWERTISIFSWGEPNPFYSSLAFSRPYEDLDPRTLAQEIQQATEQRKLAQKRYLINHPRYNVSLFIFGTDNPIRKFCQKLVGPGHGSKRVQGVDPNKNYWYPFSFFIYANIIGMVLLACYLTPLYQRQYFIDHPGNKGGRDWFTWTDIYFASVFTTEALIKIIADGFFFTPNAYFRGTWGIIDFVVLFTLWLSIATSLFDLQSIARGAGAFKSLRALRLLNVSNSARDTFHSVIVVGGWKVLSAAFVSMSLLIPFAIYGVNLFAGRYQICNDPGLTYSDGSNPVVDLGLNCIGEFQSTPYAWSVLAPRQYQNPYYDFDNFGDALFILFQIVSEEGWVDVMWSGMSATAKGLNPQPFAAPGNAVFFVVFNLLSTVFVATLFISVFMRNYTEQTGVAFLTADQRSWLELRKLLRRISPSKRPQNRPDQRWKDWCYRIAVKKHGPWHHTVTAVLVLHLVLLTVEFYPTNIYWETARDAMFLIVAMIIGANTVIRMNGLTWQRFRRSSWDLYSIFAVSGSFVTTIIAIYFNSTPQNGSVVIWLHKLFLVSLALLLIPRNNALDQLFKTAAASLPAILNLLATWFVLFLVFAIALNQTLGLTKFGSSEKANLNLRTVPKALVLLFRTSVGEGWNQIMEDFARAKTPNCVYSSNFFDSDCGSEGWARVLFVVWNIVSLYIFVSLFVSLIFESFSYVYQRSSGHSLVSREETRRFKQAWATFDPNGTGYISKEAFPKLLGELSGVFEMRIYDGDYTVGAILEDCRVENWRPNDTRPGIVAGVDLNKLNERLSTIDVDEIRRRRQRLNVFSQEVLVSAHPDKGISFTSCLMILAHYNVISDSRSLRLEEFLRRRYRIQRVTEEVDRRIVIGFFDTLYWSRIFRRRKESAHEARMVNVPQFAVPEIIVEDDSSLKSPIFPEDTNELSVISARASSSLLPDEHERRIGFGLPLPEHPPDIDLGDFGTSTGIAATSGSTRSRSNTVRSLNTNPNSPSRSHTPSPHISPSLRPTGSSDLADPFSLYDGSGGRFRNRAGSDAGPDLSNDEGLSTSLTLGPSVLASTSASGQLAAPRAGHRRQKSSVGTISKLDVFDNSAWGESIKRSFTTRKQTSKSRSRGKSDAGNQGQYGPGPAGGGPGEEV